MIEVSWEFRIKY